MVLIFEVAIKQLPKQTASSTPAAIDGGFLPATPSPTMASPGPGGTQMPQSAHTARLQEQHQA